MEQIGVSILVKEFFTWRTMVDILLMAAGLFFVYRTLLRLGTWRIVVGILAAMGLFLVARTLHLIGITVTPCRIPVLKQRLLFPRLEGYRGCFAFFNHLVGANLQGSESGIRDRIS